MFFPACAYVGWKDVVQAEDWFLPLSAGERIRHIWYPETHPDHQTSHLPSTGRPGTHNCRVLFAVEPGTQHGAEYLHYRVLYDMDGLFPLCIAVDKVRISVSTIRVNVLEGYRWSQQEHVPGVQDSAVPLGDESNHWLDSDAHLPGPVLVVQVRGRRYLSLL